MPKTTLEILDMIIADMENDVKEFDGKPFTGRTLGELHGTMCASVQALAKIVKKHKLEHSDPFALWPQYLEHLAVINRAVRRHNAKVWKRCLQDKRRADAMDRAFDSEQQRRYKERLRTFRRIQESWDKQFWWDRWFGPDRPWLEPVKPFPISRFSNTLFPVTVNVVKPTVEDYLTWRMKQGQS